MGHLNLLIEIRNVISKKKKKKRFEQKKNDIHQCGWMGICDNGIEFG